MNFKCLSTLSPQTQITPPTTHLSAGDFNAYYDDTFDKKRVNSCVRVLKHLFWRELSDQKQRQNPPEKLSPMRY